MTALFSAPSLLTTKENEATFSYDLKSFSARYLLEHLEIAVLPELRNLTQFFNGALLGFPPAWAGTATQWSSVRNEIERSFQVVDRGIEECSSLIQGVVQICDNQPRGLKLQRDSDGAGEHPAPLELPMRLSELTREGFFNLLNYYKELAPLISQVAHRVSLILRTHTLDASEFAGQSERLMGDLIACRGDFDDLLGRQVEPLRLLPSARGMEVTTALPEASFSRDQPSLPKVQSVERALRPTGPVQHNVVEVHRGGAADSQTIVKKPRAKRESVRDKEVTSSAKSRAPKIVTPVPKHLRAQVEGHGATPRAEPIKSEISYIASPAMRVPLEARVLKQDEWMLLLDSKESLSNLRRNLLGREPHAESEQAPSFIINQLRTLSETLLKSKVVGVDETNKLCIVHAEAEILSRELEARRISPRELYMLRETLVKLGPILSI